MGGGVVALLSETEAVGESGWPEMEASKAAAEEGMVSADCCLETHPSWSLLPCVLAVETASVLSTTLRAADVGVCCDSRLAMLLWDELRLPCCMRWVGVSRRGCSVWPAGEAGCGVVRMDGGCGWLLGSAVCCPGGPGVANAEVASF